MYKVLVVDDEPNVRKILKWTLRDAGYETDTAGDQAEALDMLVQRSYDFAVVDVRLFGLGEDDISGITLSIAFKKLRPMIQIILLSHYERTRKIDRAVRYSGEIISFISKTDGFDKQIVETLQNAEKKLAVHQSNSNITKREFTRVVIGIQDERPIHVRASGNYLVSRHIADPKRIATQDVIRQGNSLKFSGENWHIWVKGIGDQLWKEVFEDHKEINSVFSKAKGRSSRITLTFETSIEKMGLPFEFICSDDDTHDYLILQHPVSRFLSGISPERNAINPEWLALLKTELRILLIASNTYPPIDGADQEIAALYHDLQIQRIMPVKVKMLETEKASYEAVQKELSSENYDIVHYAGHGWYDPETPNNSSLFFWSEPGKKGKPLAMRATELTNLLRQSAVRLFYLSSCYGTTSADGADISVNSDFLGIAHAIINAGVPSVIGFRSAVGDAGAIELASHFYKSFLNRGRLDVALWEARCELAANRSDPTWLLPILINQD